MDIKNKINNSAEQIIKTTHKYMITPMEEKELKNKIVEELNNCFNEYIEECVDTDDFGEHLDRKNIISKR